MKIKGPAYRIHTHRMIIRCWTPSDAPLLKEAIDESLDHLRPWLPWVEQEPEELEAKVQRLRGMRGNFDLNHDFNFGVFSSDEQKVIGGSGLHTRAGKDALEIGYWIHADQVNKGFATEIAAAMTKVGFELHNIDRIEIHCDPANVPSSNIPKKLGFIHEATLRHRKPASDGIKHDEMIWTLFRKDYEASEASDYKIEAFDVLGNSLIDI